MFNIENSVFLDSDANNIMEEQRILEEKTKQMLKRLIFDNIDGLDVLFENTQLALQWIYDKNGKIFSSEVLSRIELNKGEIISPLIFFDCLDKSKRNTDFDTLILEKVIRMMGKKKNSVFFVNFYGESLLSPSVQNIIKEFVDKNKALSSNLVVEIIEKSNFADMDEYNKVIDFLKNLGLKIAIDDITDDLVDKSNINNCLKLKEIQNKEAINFLKIDGDFIKHLFSQNHPDYFKDFQDLIFMLKDLFPSAKIVVEKISSEELFKSISKIEGIDLFQGFYFNTPSLFDENN